VSDGEPRQPHPWLRLLRVPNLLTAPGDALAGGALAAEGWPGAEIWGAAGAMLFVYAGGMVLNDYFDMARDAVQRPERPLPSGQVTPWVALIVGLALLVAGPVLAWLTCGGEAGRMALVVAFLVVAYDAGGKHVPVLGSLLMGACRGGSVLVGAFAVGDMGAAFPVAALALLYTASITFLAKDEATDRRPGMVRAQLPGLAIVAGVVMMRSFFPLDMVGKSSAPLLIWLLGMVGGPGALLLIWAALEAGCTGYDIAAGERPVPPSIGRLVRIMITMQAAWIIWFLPPEGALAPLVVAIMLILRVSAGRLGRRVSGS